MTKLLGVAVLIAMIAISTLAGRSYRWCVPAERVTTSSCCAHDGDEAPAAPETAAVRSSCCEDRNFGRLPASDPRVEAPLVPLNPVAPACTASILPPLPTVAAMAFDLLPRSDAARARAGPLTSGERCNLLQVFRC